MTPLQIEILLNYFCCGNDFKDLKAPAVVEAISEFCKRGILIEVRDAKEGQRKYVPNNEPLNLYIKTICAVPLPVQKWHIP